LAQVRTVLNPHSRHFFLAAMRSSLPLLSLAALAAGLTREDEELSLLQTNARQHLGSMTADKWSNRVMREMERLWTTGFWAMRPLSFDPRCGKSTFKELQVTIPKWREQHPEADGFCYFQNHAHWFAGSSDRNHRQFGRNGATHMGKSSFICESAGENAGPKESFKYDGGEISWSHTRNCIDIVDDPYCYSLGWLKGQGGWDESLMDNHTAWEQLAREQCDKLQAEFHFDDEEVTVGKHIFSTPLYFKRTWNSLQGTGTPIDRRLHAEHVYTKCLLGRGAAPNEMSYCYFKGCVLPNGKIGHLHECDYDGL